MDFKGLAFALANGWISGAAGILTMHPMDTVRVRMQAMSLNNKSAALPSTMQVFRDTVRRGGVRSLFFGVIPPVTIRGVSFALQRGTIYVGNNLLDHVCTPAARLWLHQTSVDQALCGAMAGVVSQITDLPAILLKSRAQVSQTPGEHAETFRAYHRAALRMYRSNGGGFAGVRSLYLGAQPHVPLAFLSWGMFYWLYDVFRQRDHGPLVAGSVAALLSWPTFYPLDVLRTHIQTADPKLGLTYADHYRRFGVLSVNQWYTGLPLTLVRAVPRCAITFVVLEGLQSTWR